MRDHIHELHLVEVGRNQALGRARVTLALQIEIFHQHRFYRFITIQPFQTRARGLPERWQLPNYARWQVVTHNH